MTVESLTRRKLQTADGAIVDFAFDFLVTNADHLVAYHESDLETPLSKVSVTGVGNQAGGSVELTTAPPAGTVVLVREVPFTQTYDYTTGGRFPAETHEQLADNAMMAIQQLQDEVGRSVKLPLDATATDLEMPNPAAGKTIVGKIDESGWEDGPTTDEISNAQTYATNASNSASAAAASQSAAAASEAKAADWAEELEDVEVETGKYSAKHHAAKAAAEASSQRNIPARNTVLTKDVLSQAGTLTAGFSASLNTSDDGIDGTQFIRFSKDRNNIASWVVSDSIRGDNYLSCDTTAAEVATIPALNADDVSFQWSLPELASGLTNRNKAYTAHYNPYMNVSAVAYEGDSVDGHDIPHHLPVVPELIIIKNRDTVNGWPVISPFIGDSSNGDFLKLDTTDTILNNAAFQTIISNTTIKLDTDSAINNSTDNHIMYNFASKSGACKISTYTGTGAAGNYVSTEVDGGDAFKPAWVLIKNLTTAIDWNIFDGIRDPGLLAPNTSASEVTGTTYLTFDDDGFHTETLGAGSNTLNDEYLFIAFAESSIDATKAVTNYTLPTNADQLAIKESLFTFADGFNANGQVDVSEQVAAGTLTFGVGHEEKKYYLYRDNGVAYGQSENRPLVGLTRQDADKYGIKSKTDALALHANSRDTSKHFDYESDSGVVLASGENANYEVHNAFDKNSNDIVADVVGVKWLYSATTNSWVQYKHNEKRILKSWRIRCDSVVARSPKRFTIEGSNDGLNWTAIDSSYTSADYVPNGIGLWGDLGDTTANTAAYLYHRINITANNGDATHTAIADIEFNTIIESDYYLIDEAKMYNNAGTEIDRVYYGECLTDAGGDVVSYTNYPAGKQQLNEMEVHGKSVFHGDVLGEMFATASGKVDGSVNPPLIQYSNNIKDIVDISTGVFKLLFEAPMDNLRYTIIGVTEETGRIFSVNTTSRTVNSVIINIAIHTGSLENRPFEFIVFGGKEIK